MYIRRTKTKNLSFFSKAGEVETVWETVSRGGTRKIGRFFGFGRE
jgi:hypothetical protein